MVYTVVYEGDPTGVKILSGEPAPGRAFTVTVGDCHAELRQREAEIRKLSHACLSEAIRLCRQIMQRQDCDIPGESWMSLTIRTMEVRQKEIVAEQMAAIASEDDDPSARPAPLAREG